MPMPFMTGSDHGVKANGDGWLLTVALLEATSLPPGSVDPYVVLSCNGITRTSSVQLQTLEPQWNGQYIVDLTC
jgi:Ca2+-dependent lipid-binding protein